jgi:hypothetical protein
MSNANVIFSKKVYKLQNSIVRELNNAHIFLEQIQPVMAEAKAKYEASESKKDKRYYVPSVNRTKFAKRTDRELKDIYDHYLSVGLFEAFLVNSVSRFEIFLGDILIEFLSSYPFRILERARGIEPCSNIEVKDLLRAESKDSLLANTIATHVSAVFRQRPSIYMPYIAQILGAEDDPSFKDYYEILATRDLVVHNSRVVNKLYLDKSGDRARGTLGDTLPVDQDYYYDCLAKLKKVSGALKRDVEKKYGEKPAAAEQAVEFNEA